MALFDIYLGKVYFDNGIDYKYRPILQIFENDKQENAFAVITSNTSRKGNGEVFIVDYEQTGLKGPSNIRLSKRLNNPSSKIYIGKLSRQDQISVLIGLKENYNIEKHKTEDFDDEFNMNYSLLEVINEK